MNPLDLRGPEFLVFYAAVVAAALALIVAHRTWIERGETPRIPTADPYLLAYLRGGTNHAATVAAVSLIERGVLRRDGDRLEAVSDAGDKARDGLERAVCDHFFIAKQARSMFDGTAGLDEATRRYAETLQIAGALPDEAVTGERAARFALVAVGLLALALTKIGVAFERGHSNVEFLVILAIGGIFAAYKLAFPRRTARGDALLNDLKSLYADLRTAGVDAAGTQLQTAGALFGATALAVPYVDELFPKAKSSDGSGCGASCGGGCGGCGGCGA